MNWPDTIDLGIELSRLFVYNRTDDAYCVIGFALVACTAWERSDWARWLHSVDSEARERVCEWQAIECCGGSG